MIKKKNMRNFWVEVDVDGYQNILKGGPRHKEGGTDITLYQREDGASKTAVEIRCRAYGSLLVTTVDINGERVGSFRTER